MSYPIYPDIFRSINSGLYLDYECSDFHRLKSDKIVFHFPSLLVVQPPVGAQLRLPYPSHTKPSQKPWNGVLLDSATLLKLIWYLESLQDAGWLSVGCSPIWKMCSSLSEGFISTVGIICMECLQPEDDRILCFSSEGKQLKIRWQFFHWVTLWSSFCFLLGVDNNWLVILL